MRLAAVTAMTFMVFFCLFSSAVYAEGILNGRVVFEGTVPPAEKVEVKSDIPTCGNQKEVRKIRLGAGNGLADAVVVVQGAEGTQAAKEGLLDQVHCEFSPHVQVLPVGSTLKITSSDPVLHNAHGFYEDGSTVFNIAVPISGMEVPIQLKKEGVIKLRCDAGHTWMSAYVVAVSQPYYALTDDDGNFTMENIPAGNYEMEVWHEWLGRHREPIGVKDGSQSVTITLKGK
jgi:hypothetical protein